MATNIEGGNRNAQQERDTESFIDNSSHFPTHDSDDSPTRLELVGSRIIQIMVPVTLCSFYVLALIKILASAVVRSQAVNNVWSKLGIDSAAKDDSFFTTLLNNIIIGLGVVLLIVCITLLMLFIFYMGWHRFLIYYFYVPSLIILSIVTPVILGSVLESYNVALDWFTLIIFTWNFTTFGMISIFGIFIVAPLCAQQFYHIHNSALLAVIIIQVLPGWAPWLILVILVFWDLFAVLAPFGPLNLILDMAEKEGVVDMPGLIYSTDVNDANLSESVSKVTTKPTPNDPNKREDKEKKAKEELYKRKRNRIETIESDDQSDELDATAEARTVAGRDHLDTDDTRSVSPETTKRKSIEEKGINIGLGDFVFYSLLIGLTVKDPKINNYYVTLAAMNGILFGLVITLIFLAKTRRAVPALPVSIVLALILAALTNYLVPDFSNQLAAEQIFI